MASPTLSVPLRAGISRSRSSLVAVARKSGRALEDGVLVAAEGGDVGDVHLLGVVVGHTGPEAVEGQAGLLGPLLAPDLRLAGHAADDEVLDAGGVPEAPGDGVAAVLGHEVELLVGAVAGIDEGGMGELKAALDEVGGAHGFPLC